MMKTCAFLFLTLLSSAFSAPAVVWHSSESNGRALHSSVDLNASDLMKNVLSEAPEADLSAVIFLVGKGDDGSEQLTALASSGKLPKTFAKYNDASGVFHHVSGIESPHAFVREAGRIYGGDKKKREKRVLQVTLGEFSSKLASLGASAKPVEVEIDNQGTQKAVSSSKKVTKRERALSQADVFIVNVSSKEDAERIDSSITGAIDSSHVGSVVLAGVRSVDEVKHERFLYSQRRLQKMEQDASKRGRRRLEQEADGDQNDAQNNGQNDMSGVYYVQMTPNIFSGLLFTFFFIVVVFTGISCMSDIQGGDDTYTDKYPSLGREA